VIALSGDGGLAMLHGTACVVTARQEPALPPTISYMSTTTSVSGRAQQTSTWPSGGGSRGSGA
jgi:hypothetical protein